MIMSCLLAVCAGAFIYIAALAARALADGHFPRRTQIELTRRECLLDLAGATALATVCLFAAWHW